MLAIILSGFFFLLAAASKAVADTLKDHFDTSVFKNRDPRFWNPNESWKYVGFLPLSKYRPDAWHMANSLMIASFIGAAIFHRRFIDWYWELVIAGAWFIVVFNLFYNKILKGR